MNKLGDRYPRKCTHVWNTGTPPVELTRHVCDNKLPCSGHVCGCGAVANEEPIITVRNTTYDANLGGLNITFKMKTQTYVSALVKDDISMSIAQALREVEEVFSSLNIPIKNITIELDS